MGYAAGAGCDVMCDYSEIHNTQQNPPSAIWTGCTRSDGLVTEHLGRQEGEIRRDNYYAT